MDNKADSVSTVPSGTTGTEHGRSGDSHGQTSSGESSESRITTADYYRIGGPGSLPRWPLLTSSPVGIEKQVAEAVLDIAISHLSDMQVDYTVASLCTRTTKGATTTPADTTLLIRAPFEQQRDTLVALLDTLLTVLPGIGYVGRIEIIDRRAVKGRQTFLPKLTQAQQDSWETTLERTIAALGRCGSDWRQITLVNRGYWEEVSRPTVLIKTRDLSAEHHPEIRDLRSNLADQELDLEITGIQGLWGLFLSAEEGAMAEKISQNLGWPINTDYHGMGLSVSRNEHNTCTMGGYLKVRHGGNECTLGLTCYHGVRVDEMGSADLEIQDHGGVALSWRCQSPSQQDMSLLYQRHLSMLNKPIPPNLPLPVKLEEDKMKKEASEKLDELQKFDPYIGNILGVSGWRNREYGTGLSAPLVFMDWACIEISLEKCPYPVNTINKVAGELPESFLYGVSHWKATKAIVDTIADMPTKRTVVFKRGRTTGLTGGELQDICPSSLRILGLPAKLHHRAFTVTTGLSNKPFGLPGDSGAWCLNGNGDVVGQLVAGDSEDGSGLIVPFKLLLNDMEDKLGLKPGSIGLA